jgi:hypothetical protein
VRRRRNAGGRGRERGDPRARLARARAAAEAGDRAALGEVYLEGLRQGVVPQAAIDALAMFGDPVAAENASRPELEGHPPIVGGRFATDEMYLWRAAALSATALSYDSLDRAYTFALILGRAAFGAVFVDVTSISETVEAIDAWWSGGDVTGMFHREVVQHLLMVHDLVTGLIRGDPRHPQSRLILDDVAAGLHLEQASNYIAASGIHLDDDTRRRHGYGVAALRTVDHVISLWGLERQEQQATRAVERDLALDPRDLARRRLAVVDLVGRIMEDARASAVERTGRDGRPHVERHLRANLRPWVLDGCPVPWPAVRAVEALADA